MGKVFEGKAYGFRKQKMNEFCPVCGVKFEVEPGYFYAAMYVSYAFSVAQIVSLAVATYIITRSESAWLYLGVLFFTTLIFAPFNFRYSRLVLLHYMTPKISYNPRYEEEAADVEKQ
ncbi:hypothetical protein HMPREF0765_2607 [Sphingobacterium spiritivorum ATCC 33300]|uniref:DUF983 domain-containing protein n=1 Tax=Sphingobacterium spiritivorum ATCC 33300 TaxID=525372 RepID=C2FZ51_SPHSI|nr:hypothetical protein HMPREF0765_2607 [Sphingobacterium spiritivorum ATCC 33300]